MLHTSIPHEDKVLQEVEADIDRKECSGERTVAFYCMPFF